MEENKIVFKSIDEQLAEEERQEAAERKSSVDTVEKATTKPKRGRKKLRLKKSVRRTVGSLLLATSLVVAAIPTGGVSADSSGVYKGSDQTVKKIVDAGGFNTSYDVKNDIKTTSTEAAGNIGGFPLVPETDSEGHYIKRDIGGRDFYVVDSNGYASLDYVRPIYSLNTGGTYIKQYFETNGTDDVYIPPSGKLNLVTGYVNGTSTTEIDKWEYNNRLYKLEGFKKTLGGNDLYGKKLSIYDRIEVETCKVKFLIEDDVQYLELEVRKGDKLSEYTYPSTPPASTKGGTNGHWSIDPDQVINSDTTVKALYTYPSSQKGPVDPSFVVEGEGEGSPADGTQETEEGAENSAPASNEAGSETETGNNEEPTTGEGSEETPINSEETPINSEETEGETVTETVETEHADAEGPGLTGVLLQFFPNDTDPDKREYKDDPAQVIYVCDEYAPIANICNEAFKGTTNVRIVDLPTNIRNIGDEAFKGSGVTSITLGDGLQKIGASAFEDCQDLTTASYSNNMALTHIGSKCFANSGLSTLSNTGSGFIIPYTVKNIGNAAFLGNKMTALDFSEASGCTVGDCTFAQCKSLVSANLNYRDGTLVTISNLDGMEGLFAEDDVLKEATMPKGFSGTLKPGTFGSCGAFDHIIFKDGLGTFSDNEFDAYQITVEGPEPATLNAATPKSYASSIKETNDYVYRYFSDDTHQHEIATEYGYTHNDNFFKDKTAAKSKSFIFDVDETNGYELSRYHSTVSGVDLEIGNNIGKRNDGDIPVKAIGKEVFKDDTTIKYLQLNANLDHVYDSAFDNTKIEKLWAYVDGTEFHPSAFANNKLMTRATFAYGGEAGSKLDSKCFAETPLLNNIDFYDDNLNDGNKNLYARFFKGQIANDAFYTATRTTEITFKGPMIEGYAPWEFAIDPNSRISPNLIYTKYYSGNPWNLSAQYKNEAFEKENPVTGKKQKYSGVCLVKYPNMSSRMDKDDIDDDLNDLTNLVTVDKLEAKPASSRTTMEQDCISFTKDMLIPYGIDYIDIAESQIHDPAKKSYYVFNDDNDLYEEKEIHNTEDKPIYKIFRYNPDILSVTFAPGGVSEFPDRMFEGVRNLETVTFAGNVTNLGKLPFYMPDTEAYDPKFTKYEPDSFPHLGPGNTADEEFRSHLEGVYFTGESDTASSADEKYYSTSDSYGFSTGIIKGDNGTRVKVVQIVPSRGDTCGAESITADELSDVDEYADYAARDCDAIKTIVFPDNGCDISYGCFMDCDRLKNITMPNNFFSVADQAFAGISTNMDVTFPYNNVNLNELPFDSASKDGLTMPDVTFHVHKDAEYLMDYADKNKNINYETIADAIKLTYRDRYDDSYFQQVDAMANGYTFGSNYPPSVLPTYGGKTPDTWTGIDKNGKTVDWKTDVLTTDTTFTSVYDSTEKVKVYFVDYDGSPIKTVTLTYGEILTKAKMPSVPEHTGMKFLYWSPNLEGEEITETATCTAKYDSSSSSSSSTSSSTSTTSSTGGGSTSKTSTSSKSSSSSSASSSSSSSTAYPVYVSSQDTGAAVPATVAGVGSTVFIDEGSGGSGSGGGSTGKKGKGNATVISTTGGISDTGKMSATVNGSSDNYVIKITQTQEADDMGLAALHGAYGDDISAIRYLPFDISLYDSTGTNKISPVPEGVSISLTMPIPDDLAIYGGNAKIASTAGGVLDRMEPRFTVINGVPCMTYTCTHFSPYMVWVDTNNLTEAGIADMTPKTADGIHPKWFLCFGLAAIAVVMFLKKDPEEYLKKAA